MPTMKDIAREAGVSHGTVSNVLNGNGKVSAKKILLVEQAAKRLGYTMHTGAKLLRKGNSNILGLLLPNIAHKNYLDFYLSFRQYAQDHGHTVNLYFSDYNAQTELGLIHTARSDACTGLAVFSSLGSGRRGAYRECGYHGENIVYLDCQPQEGCTFIGFDHPAVGRCMAQRAICNSYASVAVITAELDTAYHDAQALRGFYDALVGRQLAVEHLVTDKLHCCNSYLEFLESRPGLEAVFIYSYAMAEAFRSVADTFYKSRRIDVFSTSPIFTTPKTGTQNYELNYRLMGKTAAQELLGGLEAEEFTPRSITLQNDGFRNWHPPTWAVEQEITLRLLTLDSPTARIIESVAGLFTKDTGIHIEIVVQGYDEIHSTLSEFEQGPGYDIIRLDHTWLSYFGKKIFMPLEEIDPSIPEQFEQFLPNSKGKFSSVGGRIYCLPETPSAQLLFYRKDLFENAAMKRLYKERYRAELAPPSNFEEYNRIARFFTREYSPGSPTRYGTTLTLGNTGVAATEFLSRYVCQTDSFFDRDSLSFRCGEGAVAAMGQLEEAVRYASPRHSEWWRDAAREFADGDTAMTILFSNFASEILNPASKIVGKIGYSLVPGGNPLLGGGSIGISSSSGHPREALLFIQWLCSEPISTFTTFLGNVSPCTKTYDNYEVVDRYPWLPLSKESIGISRISRTPENFTGRFDERGFLNLIGSAVIDCCVHHVDARVALGRVAEQFPKVLLPE